MFTNGIFTVKVEKRYKELIYYKNKVPIQSFLVEMYSGVKSEKKLKIYLRVAGKIAYDVLDSCVPGQYCIVEGAISNYPLPNFQEDSKDGENEDQNNPKFFELNAYKIYPLKI